MATAAEEQFVEKSHAEIYSSFRKETPTEIIERIVAFLKEKVPEPLDTAVDVGCGIGQSTVILAPYFKHVQGCDVSEAQIERAKANRSLKNVTYTASPAEELPFSDGTVQLVTAGTSMHRFNLDLFLPEVRRILCLNGVMAVYGFFYMKPELEDPARAAEIDELWDKYYEVLEPHIMMRPLTMLKRKYDDVKFPFEEIVRCPDVRCRFKGHLLDVVNYVTTFSGFQNFKKENSRAAEECTNSFHKRLYEICAASGHSPEDPITLYRDYQLILCRKTKDGPFQEQTDTSTNS